MWVPLCSYGNIIHVHDTHLLPILVIVTTCSHQNKPKVCFKVTRYINKWHWLLLPYCCMLRQRPSWRRCGGTVMWWLPWIQLVGCWSWHNFWYVCCCCCYRMLVVGLGLVKIFLDCSCKKYDTFVPNIKRSVFLFCASKENQPMKYYEFITLALFQFVLTSQKKNTWTFLTMAISNCFMLENPTFLNI